MNPQTINSIEVSSLCNQKCRYCPNKDQHKYRPVGLMSMETFEKALSWVSFLIKQGTQRELNLFSVGEPTMNPLLPDMIARARQIMPMRLPVHINTNGQWVDKTTTLITEAELDYAKKLKAAGVSHVDVSGHDRFQTAKVIRILQACNIPGRVSFDFMISPNNWAGQVDWFNPLYDAGPCPWLLNGQIMIMWDGRVTRCCIDAFATGILGSVDDDLSKFNLTSFPLCESCHHMAGQKTLKAVGCNETMI